VPSNLTALANSNRGTHLIIAEARRLGLGNIRIECTNDSPRLAAELNGEPISILLARMPWDRGDSAQSLLQLHRQLRIALSRRH
jgi:hypothetical protein